MLTRQIPSTGETVPVIGLGTWQTFDVGNDAKARAERLEVLQRFLDEGGRIIDTSPMYGRAEALTGDLLAELGARKKTFLATKVWIRGREQGIAQMRRSAELLRSAKLDLIQIHNLVDWRTHLATLQRMKAEGVIRYLGITHYTTSAFDELTAILAGEEIDFVQLPYSIAVRDAEHRLLPLAAERGVAVIVNRPFEEGALFRRARGRAVPEWAREFDCESWGEFFLKFIAAHPAVTCVIPATRRAAHLADNMRAGWGRIPDPRQREAMTRFWDSL